MRNRHLDYFVQLLENAEQGLIESMAMIWVSKLEAEYDNLRAAFEWGMENNVLTVLKMASSLQYFWYRRGYETEGRNWIKEALEHTQSLPAVEGDALQERMTIIGKAWQAMSFLASSQGDFASSIAASRKCEELARQIGDKRLLATVLAFGASSKMMSGDRGYATSVIDEVLSIAREANDPFALSISYGMIGMHMLLTDQNPAKGNEYISKGLALLNNTPHHFWQTMLLFGLGMAARFQGRFDEARGHFTPLLTVFHDMGDQHRTNMIHSECAHMERLEGHHDKAASMYRETILEWQRLGHRAAVANQLECFAYIAKALEQVERATKLFGAAEALREKIKIPMSEVEQVEYDREVADLKVNSREKEFISLWTEGRSLTMERAIQLALG
jgi:tetratricopeptide (TPR) repeat protein